MKHLNAAAPGFEGIIYPITNKVVFPLVMQDTSLCRKLIERIFPDRKVRDLRLHGDPLTLSTVYEKTIFTGVTTHGVRLDVLFEDADTWYDIEMQTGSREHIPKRSRYYHSLMDQAYLKTSQPYSQLNPQYVIFICTFDPKDTGRAVYRFQMMESDSGLNLDDLSYTILLNTKASPDNTPEELRGFFDYVNQLGIDSSDELVSEIHDHVVGINNDEKWRYVIMTFDEYLDERYEEGKVEGIAEGQAIGRAEGRAEGRTEGEAIGQIKTLISFVKDGIISYEAALEKADSKELFEQKYAEAK